MNDTQGVKRVKAVPSYWAAVVVVGAIVAIILISTVFYKERSKLELGPAAGHYIASLQVSSSADCDQDHFVIVGESRVDDLMLEIVLDGTDGTVSTRSRISDRRGGLAAVSPEVSTDIDQRFLIYALAGEIREQIGAVTTKARCPL